MSADAGSLATITAGEARAVARRNAPAVLVVALDLGVLGDALLRAGGPPGLNFSLWVLALVGTTAWLGRRAHRLEREAVWLLGGALLFAAGVTWRDSPPLKLLDMGCAAAFLGLAAYGRGGPWLRVGGVLRYGWALVAAGVNGAFGAFALAGDVDWRGSLAGMNGGTWRRVGVPALRGLALSLPVLAVFGALLAGADAIFADLLSRTFRLDIDRVVSHVVLTVVIAWAAAGYLRELVAGPLPGTDRGDVAIRPPLGIVELAIPLGLLDLLFASFVAVQVHYFFGGAATVQATVGLTYAEYARAGFFELVAVAALVLPLLLATDALLERRGPGDVWIFRSLAGAQIALVFAIMASAVQRMRMYQDAFGLTELRLYTTAFMLWLAVVFVWFAATVLAKRRRAFALGALVSGVAMVAALNGLNPDALIVRVNAARAAGGASFDGAYAARLSGDAVPALAEWLAVRGRADDCAVERRLVRRWVERRGGDWRAWNVGQVGARAAVRRLVASQPAWAAECGRAPAGAGRGEASDSTATP